MRLTDPTGMQATPRVSYIPATIDWLKENGGGGGGGAAPLVVVGGLMTYAAQHPEQSVPFVAQMANDLTQALTNPMGFATNTIGDLIVASQNNTWKDQVKGFVDNINLHLDFLEGVNGSHGGPNEPYNKDKWKKDIKKAVNNIKDKLNKLKKPFAQVLKERGWSEEQIETLQQRLQDQGIDSPK